MTPACTPSLSSGLITYPVVRLSFSDFTNARHANNTLTFRVLNDPSTVRSDWPTRSPDVRSRTCQCSANGYVSATSRMRCSNRFKFCVICSTQGYVVLRRREFPINIANLASYEWEARLQHATCRYRMVQSHNQSESWIYFQH